MASIINSAATGSVGLVMSGNGSDSLEIQTAGITAIAIDPSQNVDITGNLTINNGQQVASVGKAIAMSLIFG
jgi:hypothetical protein